MVRGSANLTDVLLLDMSSEIDGKEVGGRHKDVNSFAPLWCSKDRLRLVGARLISFCSASIGELSLL